MRRQTPRPRPTGRSSQIPERRHSPTAIVRIVSPGARPPHGSSTGDWLKEPVFHINDGQEIPCDTSMVPVVRARRLGC
jgi:hypothetical protein